MNKGLQKNNIYKLFTYKKFNNPYIELTALLIKLKNIKVLPPKKKVSSFDKTYKYTFTPHSLYHKIFILSTGNRYIFINIFLH